MAFAVHSPRALEFAFPVHPSESKSVDFQVMEQPVHLGFCVCVCVYMNKCNTFAEFFCTGGYSTMKNKNEHKYYFSHFKVT